MATHCEEIIQCKSEHMHGRSHKGALYDFESKFCMFALRQLIHWFLCQMVCNLCMYLFSVKNYSFKNRFTACVKQYRKSQLKNLLCDCETAAVKLSPEVGNTYSSSCCQAESIINYGQND